LQVGAGAIPLLIVMAAKHVAKCGVDKDAVVAFAWLSFIVQGVCGDAQWAKLHMECVHSLIQRFGDPLVVPQVNCAS